MAKLTLACLVLVLIGSAYAAPDNRGTEFIIGYMANYRLSNDVQLFVTTSRTTQVDVYVTAPRYPSINLNAHFTVTAGMVKQLFISNKIRGVATALETKGILVKADDEVVVYGTNIETYSNDAFLAYPLDVLGKEYYAVSHHPTSRPCEFMIIGVEDQTTVTIKYGGHSQLSVTYSGSTYGPGSTQTITVNKFDTYQAQSWGDLTGSYVSADKKFAFMSGNERTNVAPGRSMDTLVDMMLPVRMWGKIFAIVPTPFRTTGDELKIIGSEDGTTGFIQCSGSYYKSLSLNAGAFVQYISPSDQVCYCQADKAIMVIIIVLSQQSSSEPADPALISIPPIEQYAADYTFATPKYTYGLYRNLFMFVVKKAEKDGLLLNGNPLPANTVYTDVPNTVYVGGFIEVPDGTHTVRHSSPISVFGGFMYGTARYETYGMCTGLRMSPINEVCVNSTNVIGDGVDNDCDGLIDEEICVGGNSTDDDGDGQVDEDCAKPLPIHGNWGQWGAWSGLCYCINATHGNEPRFRQCDDPAPQYDGNQCVGNDVMHQSCTPTAACPVDGGYTAWTSWTTCSITCGTGQITRSRTCTNPAPANGGQDCSSAGSATQQQDCFSATACPAVVTRDGGWGIWEGWSTCTKTCGTGRAVRARLCNNPTPMNGLTCTGDALEIGDCNTFNCSSSSNSSTNGFTNNICPANFFPCESGQIMCISIEFRCDCYPDCYDGSDEVARWALCDNSQLSLCGNAQGLKPAPVLLVLLGLLLWFQ